MAALKRPYRAPKERDDFEVVSEEIRDLERVSLGQSVKHRPGVSRSTLGRPGHPGLGLAEAHSCSSVTGADHLYAGLLKSPFDDLKGGASGDGLACLEQSDCHHADLCFVGQLLLSPIEKTAGGATLSRGKHGRANTRF